MELGIPKDKMLIAEFSVGTSTISTAAAAEAVACSHMWTASSLSACVECSDDWIECKICDLASPKASCTTDL